MGTLAVQVLRDPADAAVSFLASSFFPRFWSAFRAPEKGRRTWAYALFGKLIAAW